MTCNNRIINGYTINDFHLYYLLDIDDQNYNFQFNYYLNNLTIYAHRSRCIDTLSSSPIWNGLSDRWWLADICYVTRH